MITLKPDCLICKHFINGIGFNCKAFENGIPDDIIKKGAKHSAPLKNQKNKIVFEKISGNEISLSDLITSLA